MVKVQGSHCRSCPTFKHLNRKWNYTFNLQTKFCQHNDTLLGRAPQNAISSHDVAIEKHQSSKKAITYTIYRQPRPTDKFLNGTIFDNQFIRMCDSINTSNTGKKLKFTVTDLTTRQLVTFTVTKLTRALGALGITQAPLTSTITSYSELPTCHWSGGRITVSPTSATQATCYITKELSDYSTCFGCHSTHHQEY